MLARRRMPCDWLGGMDILQSSRLAARRQTRHYGSILRMYNFREWSDFYDTDAWDALRRYTLRRYGLRCMRCGATNTELHVDHIWPRSRYPQRSLDADNLQVLCRKCNYLKGGQIIDYRRGNPHRVGRSAPATRWFIAVSVVCVLAYVLARIVVR